MMPISSIQIHEANLVQVGIAPVQFIGIEINGQGVRPTEVFFGQLYDGVGFSWRAFSIHGHSTNERLKTPFGEIDIAFHGMYYYGFRLGNPISN